MANNAQTHWVPTYVKEKRFHNWLADAHDWAVSRSRFWGTPLPVWASKDMEEIVVIGSVAELEELSGHKVRRLPVMKTWKKMGCKPQCDTVVDLVISKCMLILHVSWDIA